MTERETDLVKGGERERERERENKGSIWAELELISRWLVVVASNGDDWSGGDGLWRSNERFNEKRDLGKRKKK